MMQLRAGAAGQSVAQKAIFCGRDPGQGREAQGWREDGYMHVDR